MGLAQPLHLQTQPWFEEDWQPLQRQVINFSKTRTLQSTKNGSLVDEYQLIWQTISQFEFYLKSFNWRSKRNNQSPIVGSIGLKAIIGGDMCSNKMIANVYLEHIGIRLSQIDQISLSDSLYMVITALEGFHELYNHSGYFRVQEQQICIDRVGKVKVWVNKDLSKNYSEVDIQSEGLRRSEIHMVRQIVDIIEQNTDLDQILQPSLSQYLFQLKRKEGRELGFEYAQVAVLEYVKINNIVIPNRIDAATELYQTDLPIHQSTSSHFQFSTRVIQKPEIAKQIQLKQTNQNLMMSHQSMPNLQHPRPCNFQYVYPYPPNTLNNTYETIQAKPLSMQKYQSQVINHNVRENMVHSSYEHFVPQSSVRLMEKQSEYLPKNPSLLQIPSTTKSTTNTQPHMPCLSQANNCVEEKDDRRNTMKSMPVRQHLENVRDKKTNYQLIRYSQYVQQDRNNHFNSLKINHDRFGLTNQQKMFKNHSNNSSSSYKFGSSNSSRRSKWKAHNRRGSTPSRRVNHSRHQSSLSGKEETTQARKYFVTLGEYSFLDPEIEADMLRYLK